MSEQKSVMDKMKGLLGQKGESTPPTPIPHTEPVPEIKQVHLIVNPAAGQDVPILKTLNAAFNKMGIEWEMLLTKQAGDAERLARQAVETGVDVVAVYGGDGTVLEVARGLHGSRVPMAILPGGTANVLSVELGIPRDLSEALALLSGESSSVRAIDMGEVGGNLFFHLGIGIEGQITKSADRAAKDRSGLLAYIFAALKELRNPPNARFSMLLDGEHVEVEGVDCMITTFGSIGIAGLSLSHAIDISDGLLDVLVIRDIDLRSVLSAAADAIASGDIAAPLLQWQVREVTVVADPPQSLMCDGEEIELDEIRARVVPQAVRVLVPVETTFQS